MWCRLPVCQIVANVKEFESRGMGEGVAFLQPTHLATVRPASFTETFEYDERNRQILHVSFEGVVTESVYSEATGRLVEQRFFDNLTEYNDGLGLPSETWTYTHDARGRVNNMTHYITALFIQQQRLSRAAEKAK